MPGTTRRSAAVWPRAAAHAPTSAASEPGRSAARPRTAAARACCPQGAPRKPGSLLPCRVPDALLGAGSHPGSEAAPGPAARLTLDAPCTAREAQVAPAASAPRCLWRLVPLDRAAHAARVQTGERAGALTPPAAHRSPRDPSVTGRGLLARGTRSHTDTVTGLPRALGAPAGTAQAGGRGQPRPEAAWGTAGYRP